MNSDQPVQPATQPANPAPSSGGEFTPEMQAEIDAAMRHLDQQDEQGRKAAAGSPRKPSATQAAHAHDVTPAGGARPAALRGPRVVQAGREHRHGKVVSVGPTDIFIEFGPKELGVLSRVQFPQGPDGADPENLPKVGQDIEVVIDRFESGENIFLCSRPGMVQKADWEMLEVGQVLEAKVTGVAKGKDNKQVGLDLEVAGHRAFMPASQIGFDRIEDLSVFVGEKLKCAVSRVERMGKGNIVLSRRDVLAQERKENAAKLVATLQEGETVEGVVRKIMPFGAFVDLGGIDGLVHLSDLTYDRVGFGEKAVAKLVKEGQRVKVKILKIEQPDASPTGEPSAAGGPMGLGKMKISLGLKQVAGDPFATTTDALVEGGEVTGKVIRIAEFGAFVEISPGVDGLVHISEIDYKRVNKVEEVLKVDEVIRAKILKIDKANRRISLSIKALKAAPEPAGGGEGGGGGGGGFGGKGGKPGKGGFGKDKFAGRSAEEILKETPALRRQREKFKQFQFKGGLS